MFNIEADIEGTHYSQKDGIEARQLILDGLIKPKNSYVCYVCKIPLKQANVERPMSESFKVRPHFKKKNIDHHKECIYFEEKNETQGKSNRHYENTNDGKPKILKVPEFDLNTFEVIENEKVKFENSRVSSSDKKNSETTEREVKTSYNKLSFFANEFLKVDHKHGKDYKARDKELEKTELFISSLKKKEDNNYYNYFKHAKIVSENSIYYYKDYMRVFWSYISDKVVDFEDKFDCYIDDDHIFRINKKHVLKGFILKKRNIFLYTIPKQDETGRFIFNSTHSNLTSIQPYIPKG